MGFSGGLPFWVVGSVLVFWVADSVVSVALCWLFGLVFLCL